MSNVHENYIPKRGMLEVHCKFVEKGTKRRYVGVLLERVPSDSRLKISINRMYQGQRILTAQQLPNNEQPKRDQRPSRNE